LYLLAGQVSGVLQEDLKAVVGGVKGEV
jgi:hypothetical protein